MNLLDQVKELDEKYCFMNHLPQSLEEPGEGRLKGYLVSVKDNICVQGMPATAGSRILEGYTPPFDATAVERCRAEGAVILGKTTMDEFGFGTFNVNTPFKVPLNPLDPERTTGGSSGGAACISALADFPHLALAESTGGSISCPAAWCGVVGITPTYGRVSRWGLIDYANSLDKIGTMAKTVDEAALLLEVISGGDQREPTCHRGPPPNLVEATLREPLRVGVPREYMGEGVDPRVREAVWKAIRGLEARGAEVEEVSLPHTGVSLSSYYIIAMAEASTNLAKFCGLRYGLQMEPQGDFNEYFTRIRTLGFGEEAKRRILLGTFTRMAGYREAYYVKACQARTLVIRDFKEAFRRVDVLVAPTMPVVAPRFEEIERLEPLQHYMMDILTVAPNLAGIPMASVPYGEVEGMPVGVHLMADHFQEEKLVAAAREVEAL